MKFLCLCPVYGTPPHLIEESIQCFLDQKHPDKKLILYDDYGILPNIEHPDIYTIITTIREKNLSHKYNVMCHAIQEYDAVAIWDVDDLYLPNHLSEHNKVLQEHSCSYPKEVWSTYTGSPQKEIAGGRFWASCAVRRSVIQEIGFVDSKQANFDQQNLSRFMSYGVGTTSCTYVFRWADTDHTHGQGGMKSPSDTTWYDNYVPFHKNLITSITPQYRDKTKRIVQWLTSQSLQVQ